MHRQSSTRAYSEPSGEAFSGGEPAGGQPFGAEHAGGRPSGGEPADGQHSGGEPSGDQPSGGEPAGGQPTSVEPTVENPTFLEPGTDDAHNPHIPLLGCGQTGCVFCEKVFSRSSCSAEDLAKSAHPITSEILLEPTQLQSTSAVISSQLLTYDVVSDCGSERTHPARWTMQRGACEHCANSTEQYTGGGVSTEQYTGGGVSTEQSGAGSLHQDSQPTLAEEGFTSTPSPSTAVQPTLEQFIHTGLYLYERTDRPVSCHGNAALASCDPNFSLMERREGRSRRSRPSSRREYYDDGDAKLCCSQWACRLCLSRCLQFKKVLILLLVVAICCVLAGVVLGVLRSSLNSFLTLALMFSGLGLMLLVVVLVGWKCTPADHEPCHLLFGLGVYATVGRRGRRRRERLYWLGGVMYPEFRNRRPPPSYNASMQEYQNSAMVSGSAYSESVPYSPPPSYRSNCSVQRPGLHTVFPLNVNSEESRPPTYCQTELSRATPGGTPYHSTCTSLERLHSSCSELIVMDRLDTSRRAGVENPSFDATDLCESRMSYSTRITPNTQRDELELDRPMRSLADVI